MSKELEEQLYGRFIGQPPPKLFQCIACMWKGNKPKKVKFKKLEVKYHCPDCGSTNIGGSVDLVFWRTANGCYGGITFKDILDGKYRKSE